MGDFQIENGCLKKYTGTDAEAVVPDGITRIGETAFDECRNLVNVCLPESVTSIGRGAFYQCSRLEKIVLPEGLEKIEKELFGYCRALTSITIPGRIARIEKGAFSGCDHLKDIVILDSIKEINQGWRETQPPCKMKLTIHTTPGSYVEWFARENKICCKLLPS